MKPGYPTGGVAGQRLVQIRLTEREYALYARLAQASGMSVTRWVRWVMGAYLDAMREQGGDA